MKLVWMKPFNFMVLNDVLAKDDFFLNIGDAIKSYNASQTSAERDERKRSRRHPSIFQAAFPGSSSSRLAGEREDIYQAGYCGWYAETHNFQRQWRQRKGFVLFPRRGEKRTEAKRIRVRTGKQSARRTPREYK